MKEGTFLQTNQSTIFYHFTRSEKTDAETILFVHGVGLDLTIWDEIVVDFKRNFHILRLDLPGNGQSTLINSNNFGWNLLVEDLEYLLDHLEIDKVHFIGHCGAGNFGVELALRKKEYVVSLTLISTPLLVPTGLTENDLKRQENWSDPVLFEKKMLFLAKNICFPEAEEKTQRIINIYKQISIYTYLAYFNLYSQAIFHYKQEELVKLTLPILILVGEFDSLYPRQLSMMNLNFLQDASFFIIPNAANAIMIDQPERLIDHVEVFLQRLKHRDGALASKPKKNESASMFEARGRSFCFQKY